MATTFGENNNVFLICIVDLYLDGFQYFDIFPSQVLGGIRKGNEHTNSQKVAKFEEKLYFCSNICFLAEMPA